MRFHVTFLTVALLMAVMAAPAQTTLDFGPALPGAPAGDWTILTDQLAAYGVTFSTAAPGGVAWVGPTYAWEPARYSITSIATEPQQAPWGAEPVRVDFDPYVTAASVWGFDQSTDTDALTIKAFDSAGTMVDSMSVFSVGVPPGVMASVAADQIAYVTFQGSTLIGDGLFFDDLSFVPIEAGPQEVSIAIRGGQALGVNPGSNGVLPLVIFGSDALDVEQVDQTSLALGEAGPRQRGKSGKTGVLGDFNADAYLDLQLLFSVPELGLVPDQTELTLTGELADGTEIVAAVELRLLGPAASTEAAEAAQLRAVPEPLCLALLALGATALIGRRRR